MLKFFILFSLVSCGQRSPRSTLPLSSGEDNSTAPGLYVIGDSISTGVFANTTPASLEDITVTFAEAFGASGLSFVQYVAGGMSERLDLESAAVEKSMRRNSTAVSTTNEWGLRQAVAVKSGVTVEGTWHYNAAAFGERASDIPAQLAKISAFHETSKFEKDPSHIVVFTGGNDFCSAKSVENFQIDFEAGLKEVRSRFQSSTILVASLPPVESLPSDSIDSKTIFEYPDISLKRIKKVKFRCHEIRAKFCSEMYTADAQQRAIQFRGVMENASTVIGASFVEAIKDIPVEKESFGADCFHPSEWTQQKLAESFKIHL